MKREYDTIKVPATPEYILSAIQDSYRFSCENDPEAEPDMDLTFDSTVEDWRMACDLLPWEELGFAINEWFGISFCSSKWYSLLEPASKRTLKEVCEAVAEKADRETIRPVKIFGQECLKGGVFFTIRSKLAQAGADVSTLAPSSLLEDYSCSYWKTFYKISSQLFPNKLPAMKINNRLYDFSIYGCGLGFILLLLSCMTSILSIEISSALFAIAGVALLLLSYPLVWISAKKKPNSVDFGEIKTFRDMVNCIVDKENC